MLTVTRTHDKGSGSVVKRMFGDLEIAQGGSARGGGTGGSSGSVDVEKFVDGLLALGVKLSEEQRRSVFSGSSSHYLLPFVSSPAHPPRALPRVTGQS